KNIVLLTEINGFFDASLLHNYMDVIQFPLLLFPLL
ncbi:citrate transporter, partial [Enterococcus faecium]|nr:citrate transporter [Enterococcus faecium]MCZ1292222.1 citrate transporter [Enterococcus faecium]